jgi:hypothetical protein
MKGVIDDLSNYLLGDIQNEAGGGPAGSGGFTKVYSLTAGTTWTFSPTLFMDMTLGWARQKQDVFGPDYQSGNFGIDTLGIPGTNDQRDKGGQADARYAGIPVFNINGFSAIGNRDGWNPIFRDERTHSLSVNLTKLKGNHDIRGGYIGNFFYLDHWQPETGNPRGNFTFNANTTGLRGGRPRTSSTTTRPSCSDWSATSTRACRTS